MVRFIGDVHGKFGPYKNLIKGAPMSIQVGDMGVGFRHYTPMRELVTSQNPPFDAMSKGRHLFLRGNHDNPAVCRKQRYWIPDGAFLDDRVYCVGGAVSIDRAYRTEGLDWWPDEECSAAELDEIVGRYIDLKPEIVCTHEAPESVATELLAAFNKVKILDVSRTRHAFESMLHHHQPKYWVFGHWHQSLRFMRGRTQFQCLAELEHVDIDLEDLL